MPDFFHFCLMPTSSSPSILVAALNWGLGHATRCMPLVQALERMGARVLLASDGAALQLLKAEFPHLQAFQLPSYRIRYETESMVWNIAKQLPRILYAIRAEQWATERLVRAHGINGILSDNRYGCFSRHCHSVIMTHQLHLRVPNALLQWMADQVQRLAFKRFDALWVPDVEGSPNLSGELSHPPLQDFETKYLGILSRFKAESPGLSPQRPKASNPILSVAVVLSGPEPQRTILEQILMEQALGLPHKFVFVKGKPNALEHHIAAENVEVVSYLTSPDLNELLRKSEVVICRAGYSSLMDLAILGNKKAILIPTPGQTEQEYLGEYFARQGVFLCQNQDKIDLETALQELVATTGIPSGQFEPDRFESSLEQWISQLNR